MSIILGRGHRLLHVRTLLAQRNGGEQEICPVHHGSPLDSELLNKERATLKPGDYEYFVANSLKKKCKKKNFLGIDDRFIRDEKVRKNMFDVGRSEELCREMDKLANEDHTHHITAEDISVYRNKWWLRSNTVGSDTMPVRHRADFKQALSTLRQLKHQEDTAHQQGWKSYSSSWWSWQESWWHSSYEHHHEDGPSTD